MSKRTTPVMVFGAGFGTRMRDLTKDTPKPLIKVAGTSLIDHAIALTGNRHSVVNAHYHADQLQAHLAHTDTVTVSHETPDILETGGGLKAALPLLGDAPVLTLNSDAIWSGPNPLDLLEAAWDPDHMDALLLLVPLSRAIGFTRPGDFAIGPDGKVHRDPNGLVYTGAQMLKTDGLAGISDPAFSLNVLWNIMEDQGQLYGLEYPGRWADVGTPEGIPLAETLLSEASHV